MTKMLTGVGGVLSCAHEAVNADIFGGELHGHSYEVTAWFTNDDGADVRVFQAALNTLLALWDHKVLPVELSTAEAIARAVGTLAKCVEVEVRRPLERIYARWEGVNASVDRNPEGEKPQALSAKHESAVTNEVRQTPTTSPSSPSIELDQ